MALSRTENQLFSTMNPTSVLSGTSFYTEEGLKPLSSISQSAVPGANTSKLKPSKSKNTLKSKSSKSKSKTNVGSKKDKANSSKSKSKTKAGSKQSKSKK